jgi:hypothetical protein
MKAGTDSLASISRIGGRVLAAITMLRARLLRRIEIILSLNSQRNGGLSRAGCCHHRSRRMALPVGLAFLASGMEKRAAGALPARTAAARGGSSRGLPPAALPSVPKPFVPLGNGTWYERSRGTHGGESARRARALPLPPWFRIPCVPILDGMNVVRTVRTREILIFSRYK